MGSEIFIAGYVKLLVRGSTDLPGIANISLLGKMGSEICIAGYMRLLVMRNTALTALLNTAKYS